MPNFSPLSETPVQQVRQAVEAALASNWADVVANLRDIKPQSGANPREQARCGSKPPPPPSPAPAANVPWQKRIFFRDTFICQYCGTQTVFKPILQLLSAICRTKLIAPELFLYHPKWTTDKIHDIYYLYSTSCDHVLSRNRCGKNTEGNLLTTCYRCNKYKNYCTLEQLDWNPIKMRSSKWDGLSGYFVDLDKLCQDEKIPLVIARKGEYTRWINLLKK